MKYLLFSLMTVCLAYCSAPSKTAKSDSVDLKLENTYWQLESFQANGQKMRKALNDKAVLEFDKEGRISGHTGCNLMNGNCDQMGEQLKVQVYCTKMYCADAAEMESAIMQTMRETTTASIKDGKLILSREGSKLVYKPMKKPKEATSMNGGSAPEQYDHQPAAASKEIATTNTSANQPITGLFRYMADAANFQRCSDGKRFAVAIDGAFAKAESAYSKMEKHGAPALMTFNADIIKNKTEGHAEMLIIRDVLNSSEKTACE